MQKSMGHLLKQPRESCDSSEWNKELPPAPMEDEVWGTTGDTGGAAGYGTRNQAAAEGSQGHCSSP